MVIPGPSVIWLFFWSIILRVSKLHIFKSLILGCNWFKDRQLFRTSPNYLSRTLLSHPSSRLSVLLSWSKLRTISMTNGNLFILMMLSLASSAVVIIFLPMDAFSSLSKNTPSGNCFPSFVISSTFKGSFIWYWMLSLNMLTTATSLLEYKSRIR